MLSFVIYNWHWKLCAYRILNYGSKLKYGGLDRILTVWTRSSTTWLLKNSVLITKKIRLFFKDWLVNIVYMGIVSLYSENRTKPKYYLLIYMRKGKIKLFYLLCMNKKPPVQRENTFERHTMFRYLRYKNIKMQ